MITLNKAANKIWDVVVIGGGPSGIQAAIYAASEGLKTLVVERSKVGGQIGQTPLLENFVGHENGISGATFASTMERQAVRMGVQFTSGSVTGANCTDGGLSFDICGETIKSQFGVLAVGMSWSKVLAPGVMDAVGKCIHYGPNMGLDLQDQTVVIVGGGNSAGQTIVEHATCAKQIDVIASGLKMSQYLKDRISRLKNVAVNNTSTIKEVDCSTGAPQVKLTCGKTIYADTMLLCTGGTPNTEWLEGIVDLTEGGLIDVGNGKHSLETSLPNLFAIGDARKGSIKRIAAAIGDGGEVMTQIWRKKNALVAA
jgi:thioredoxin reductase (NADPH)